MTVVVVVVGGGSEVVETDVEATGAVVVDSGVEVAVDTTGGAGGAVVGRCGALVGREGATVTAVVGSEGGTITASTSDPLRAESASGTVAEMAVVVGWATGAVGRSTSRVEAGAAQVDTEEPTKGTARGANNRMNAVARVVTVIAQLSNLTLVPVDI